MTNSEEEGKWLWQHFALNSEQRLKAFNFFVVLSVFADGGVFAALAKSENRAVPLLLGGFVILLALAFFIIDLRSRFLVKLTVPGLMEYEKRFSDASRLFFLGDGQKRLVVSYTFAFRLLLAAQFLFGVGVVVYSARQFIC